jgi:tetratricopeptide (TPR) repeat protein
VTPEDRLQFADFELDRSAHELRKTGVRIPIEIQPQKVPAMLMERRGTVVTREEIRQKALKLDAGSALAMAGLAEVAFFSVLNSLVALKDAGPKGLAAADRSVELDVGLAQGHLFLGLFRQYYEWNWMGAQSAYLSALDLSPNNADANGQYSILLTYLGRPSEAFGYLRKGIQRDPLNLLYQHLLGVQSLWAGKHDEAIPQLRSVAARAPRMHMTHLTLGAASNSIGKDEEALSSALGAWSGVNDDEMVSALKEGKREDGCHKAMCQGDETLVEWAEKIYVLPHIISLFNAANETELACEWIKRGYQQREPTISYFNRKPFSMLVKTDPRFEERLDLPC